LPFIHPLAVVSPDAVLGEGVEVGPFCVIHPGVVIGEGTRLLSHVVVHTGSTIGKRNVIHEGAVIGGVPQDRKFAGEPSKLIMGDDNIVRECVTLHRASGEGAATVIGNGCFFMAYSHVGHNSTVQDHVTMANQVALGGYTTVEVGANIGGLSGVHQFVRVGRYAMVAGFTRVVQDVPPYMMVAGFDQAVADINAVGLRRMGITQESRMALHKACKLLYKSQLGTTHAMETVRREVKLTPEVLTLLEFEERRARGKNGRGDQP
jgi:UDP-N-acetylglucosamine acyltransferase